jgi:hypothetical protein
VGARGVLRLQVQGERVDGRGVAQHEDLEVRAVHLHALCLGFDPAPALEERERGAGQAEASGAHEDKPPGAVGTEARKVPSDDAAEREAHDCDRIVAGKDLVEPRRKRLGQACRIARVGRQGGVAVARHVGHGDAAGAREEGDVADPVRPGAVAAVQEQERRAGPPAPAHDVALAAGRLDALRRAFEARDDRGRRLARDRFVHQYDRGMPKTCWAT